MNLESELQLAIEAADAASRVSLNGFNERNFTVEFKNDNSEVTRIDRQTELAITDLIHTKRPQHGLFAEEHGLSGDQGSKHQWVIDPIDGTSNFVRGVPIWATLIALIEDEVPVLGVVCAPALKMRWWAVRGGGAFFNGEKIGVSRADYLKDATLSVTMNSGWKKLGAEVGLNRLQDDVSRVRGFGDFWQHMLVAQGAIDIAIDAIGLAPYDIGAIIPIVAEAGGRSSNRLGHDDWRSDSLITSNGRLHEKVLSYLPS